MLAEGGWIDDHARLLICGRPAYQRVPRLFSHLILARGDGRRLRLLRVLGRVDLLILDGASNCSMPPLAKTSWSSSRNR